MLGSILYLLLGIVKGIAHDLWCCMFYWRIVSMWKIYLMLIDFWQSWVSDFIRNPIYGLWERSDTSEKFVWVKATDVNVQVIKAPIRNARMLDKPLHNWLCLLHLSKKPQPMETHMVRYSIMEALNLSWWDTEHFELVPG